MSINNTDSHHLLLVRAAPALVNILDAIEKLRDDPELITALRSLACDGAQQPPIQFQARSMDIPAHGHRTEETGAHPRRRNMRPCGTCSSIKVKCKIVSRVGSRRLCQRCKDKGSDECPPYEAWKGRRNHVGVASFLLTVCSRFIDSNQSSRASVSSSVSASASASSSAPDPVNHDVYQNSMSNALPVCYPVSD